MTAPTPDRPASSVPASTLADRDEQLNAEFRPLSCERCGTEVRVRKKSPEQTSVQWQSDPAASCPHLLRRSPSAAPAQGCPELSETIRAAVKAGQLPSGRLPSHQPPSGRLPSGTLPAGTHPARTQ